MVAIRSTHLISAKEFAVDKWVVNLKLSNNNSEKKLINLWYYCYSKVKHYDNYKLLLWRGIEMGEILSTLSIDLDSMCAAMLFPLFDAKVINEEIINIKFGESINTLIKGVIDMDAILQLNYHQLREKSLIKLDNIRLMLLTTIEDFRCLIIKIAERITYLREVKECSRNKKVFVAKECFNIYAPLANRLGIWQLKWELEDLCFHYLHPNEYKKIASLLHERRIDRELYISKFISLLRYCILQKNIIAEIHGRPKHIYSIWRKIQKKCINFNEVFDVLAVRIIVERLQDCYAVLSIVHSNFYHFPDEFDDYIANPKLNGYQSIHTVVLGPNYKTIEIQIRTRQMHEDAELGIAAHWRYKEGIMITGEESGYENRIIWLRKVIFWQENIINTIKTLYILCSQVFNDYIYITNNNGNNLPVILTKLCFI